MFDKNETAHKVVAIIAQILNVDEATITMASNLETLGADSLDRLEIVMKLEEQFGIDIPDDEEAKITSVQDLVDKVHALRTK